MLGLTLQPEGVRPAGVPMLTGMVQVTGDWRGAVTIELTRPLALQATDIMFGLEGEDPDPDDVRDAVGEIANMTGGNVKALLGGGCQLSLPSVTEGVDYRVNVPGASVRDRIGFACGDEHLTVSVLEQL